MSVDINNICNKQQTLMVECHVVPYDVDYTWDDGCGGTDLWDDWYGDQVKFLINDRGASYVCPEYSGQFWRIFATPEGEAWELGHWPSTDGSISSGDGSSDLNSIIDCGFPPDGGKRSYVADAGVFSVPDPFAGAEIALSERFGIYDWNLIFEDDAISIENERNLNGFVVDGPLAGKLYGVCYDPYTPPFCDDEMPEYGEVPSGCVVCSPYERPGYPEPATRDELVPIIAALLTDAAESSGFERDALEFAAEAFNRACISMLEIDEFERFCYGPKG